MAGTRKIAAILVADIVGHGRLAGADGVLSRLRGLHSDPIDPATTCTSGGYPAMCPPGEPIGKHKVNGRNV